MFNFKHNVDIPKAPRGTLGKCHEELAELEDADSQNNRWHTVVEAADLINSTYTFVWRRYRVPFFVVIVIALLSGIYKPIVRWLRKHR
jgi:hypothetical protein